MGYDITITRRAHWSASGEPEITFAEWAAIVDRDPELEWADLLTPPTREPVMIFDPSCGATHVVPFAEWQASANSASELEPVAPAETKRNTSVLMFDLERTSIRVFRYRNGNITVRKPCKAVLMKMLAVAHKLNARVMGDDYEVYAPDGTPSHKAQFDVPDGW